MKAAEALRTPRAAGVEIALDGDDLVLEASSPPPEPVLDALSRNKARIVALQRPGGDGWSTPCCPHGTATHGHAWLHSSCWPGWHETRKAEAIDALEAMGIEKQPKIPDDFGKTGGI